MGNLMSSLNAQHVSFYIITTVFYYVVIHYLLIHQSSYPQIERSYRFYSVINHL